MSDIVERLDEYDPVDMEAKVEIERLRVMVDSCPRCSGLGDESTAEIDRLRDLQVASVALIILARYNIPPDVQGLLVYGDPDRKIRPGALSAAIKAALLQYRDGRTNGMSNIMERCLGAVTRADRLQLAAEIERLRAALECTHYPLGEIDQMRAEVERLRTEVEQLQASLNYWYPSV